MNRRETLKSLLMSSLGAGVIASTGCAGSASPARRISWTPLPDSYSYGRTAEEKDYGNRRTERLDKV